MVQTSIFEEREKWSGAIVLAAVLHILLAVAIIVAGIVGGPRGGNCGGSSSGEAVQGNLGSARPLPSP